MLSPLEPQKQENKTILQPRETDFLQTPNKEHKKVASSYGSFVYF